MDPGRTGRLALLLAAGCLAACGARSSLRASGSAGAGGSDATTTSSSTTSSGPSSATASGSGGAGGGPSGCNWQAMTTWTVEGFDGAMAFAPGLVASRTAEDLYAVTAVGQKAGGPFHFWSVGVKPWSPPDGNAGPISGSTLHELTSADYGAARSIFEGRIALSLVTSDLADLEATRFDAQVLPGDTMPVQSDIFPTQQPGSIRPLFVARRTIFEGETVEDLLGYEMRVGERRRLMVRIVSPSWGKPEHPAALGCGSAPLAASGAGTEGAFFVATATAKPLGQCDDPAAPLGAPTRLSLVYYNNPTGQVLKELASFQEAGPIEAVQLVPIEGALWIAYAVQLSGTTATLRAARVDLTGTVLLSPFDLGPIARPVSLSATRLAQQFVVAAFDRTPMGQPLVPVRLLGPGGAITESFLIVPEAVDEVAIAGDPQKKRLLVALARHDATKAPLTLSRWSCP